MIRRKRKLILSGKILEGFMEELRVKGQKFNRLLQENESKIVFQTRATAKQLATPFPQSVCVCVCVCVCVYKNIFENEGKNCSGKYMLGKIGCCHSFKAVKAAKTYFHSKHAQRDNIREGENWGTVCLNLIPV